MISQGAWTQVKQRERYLLGWMAHDRGEKDKGKESSVVVYPSERGRHRERAG